MSVWLCIPSARQPDQANQVLKLWRERGYKIALYIDETAEPPSICEELMTGPFVFPGYAVAVNALARHILSHNPDCDWIVTGGDDVEPDPDHSAEEIAQQCSNHFGAIANYVPGLPGRTFGVMQPTGDQWGDRQGAYADRVCGSPWIGREFALRINQGIGPLWPEYFHMYEDEELFCVAQKYGALWRRPDLVHFHRHWARERGRAEDMPEFLARANSPIEWQKAKRLFVTRKGMKFPGSEPR